MSKKNETHNNSKPMAYDALLAVVNCNAVGSWLEPYIGHTFRLIKKGIKITWIEIDYGRLVKRKADSSFFNYC